MDLNLKGKRAIVTGASAGIGRAIAHGLAQEGVDVAISARRPEPLAETARQIAVETGATVIPLAGDMSRLEEVQRFVREAVAALGGLDILVNSAGTSSFGPFLDHPDEDWEEAMRLKYVSHIRASREAIPHLERAGGGVIVNIIGTGGKAYLRYHLAGGASNAALMLLTTGLAAELGPLKIRVVGINPGPVRTERYDKLIAALARYDNRTTDEVHQEFLTATPTGEIPAAEDVAHLAVFLASDRARQINGTIVTIDGGMVKTI
ncbi:MAG TPA: SDR family oxidoreductase [Dehalococcoidia bacterium]|nr:SDR family oxidoreductase [Dehalococcoidia bacterium]